MAGAVRVRFAPAPTGPLHLGGARTALFNWLFARHHGGRFILRIENTDEVRSSEEFERQILEDLSWLGLEWDEGPLREGPHAPYRQTERAEVYQRDLALLQEKGRVYPCFCTHEQLEASRLKQEEKGEPPRYAGVCRKLTAQEKAERIERGERHTWRFALPAGDYSINDLIRGEVRFDLADLGDFIVARSDGSYPYLFASAVDDAEMGITHIIRGEDGLSNAPRQACLIEALGKIPPVFAHLSLLLDPEGQKLAKRDPSFTIEGLRGREIPPEAVVRYLASLGYAPAEGGALTREELVQTFDLSKVSHSPARVDQQTLESLSVRVLKELPRSDFLRQARERLQGSEMQVPEGPAAEEALAGAFQGHVKTWAELREQMKDLESGWSHLSADARDVLEEGDAAQVLRALSGVCEEAPEPFSGAQVMSALKGAAGGVKGKALFGPVRVALTGKIHGPELKHILTLLGRERVRERVARALAFTRRED